MATVAKGRRRKCFLCGRVSSPQDKSVAYHQFPKEGTRQRSLWYQFCGLSENIDRVSSATLICGLHFNESDYVFPPAFYKSGRFKLKPDAVPSHLRPIKHTYWYRRESSESPLTTEGIYSPPVLQVMIRESGNVETTELSTSSMDPLKFESDDLSPYSGDCEDIKEKSMAEHPLSPITPSTESPHTPTASESTPAKCRFGEPRYVQDITPEHVSTPKRACRVLKFVKETDKKKSAKIKSLQSSNKNLKKRVEMLKQVVRELKTQLKNQKRRLPEMPHQDNCSVLMITTAFNQ